MRYMAVGLLGLSALLAGTAQARDAQSVVAEASKVLGADKLTSVEYAATGFDYAVGQQATPNAAWPKFIEKDYKRGIDYTAGVSRVERVRTQGENPPRGGGGQPINGEQKQTQLVFAKADVPWAQQADLWVTPYGFLRAAKDSGANATLETRNLKGVKYDVVTVNLANLGKLVGYIDDKRVVQRVETWVDNAVLGDTLYESTYSDYRDVDGIKFPYKIDQKQGGYPIYDLNVREVKVNPQLTFAAANPPAAPSAAKSEKLGDGVYLISGGYTVIAIDFEDHITLLESGQNDARAAAVIAEAKRIIPGKPIKSVVNTHPHFDHSGGLRTFVAEDITIVTHELNKSYLGKVLAQPRTAGPQANGKRPKIEGVGDKTVLTDGKRRVELYRLKDFGHHDGMLVAYLPNERVLFQADAYNPQAADAVPPTPANPFNTSLLANIEGLKLDVERIVPVHAPSDNRIVTLAELERWVKGDKLAAR